MRNTLAALAIVFVLTASAQAEDGCGFDEHIYVLNTRSLRILDNSSIYSG